MIRASVNTAWEGDGASEDTAFSPTITTDHPDIVKYEDNTGQPSENLTPDPNMYTVLIECEETTLNAIIADNAYYLNWSEVIPEDDIGGVPVVLAASPKNPDEEPPANEFGLLRSWLAQSGFSQAWITATIGDSVNGRDRSQITTDLIAGLKVL